MQVIQSDEGYKVWKGNKLVGQVIDDNLYGINSNGYGEFIQTIEGKENIAEILAKWLKSRK